MSHMRLEHIAKQLNELDRLSNLKNTSISNDASLESIDQQFLTLAHDLATIEKKRAVIENEIGALNKKPSELEPWYLQRDIWLPTFRNLLVQELDNLSRERKIKCALKDTILSLCLPDNVTSQ